MKNTFWQDFKKINGSKRFYALDEDSWKKEGFHLVWEGQELFWLIYTEKDMEKYRSSNFNNTPLLSDELMERFQDVKMTEKNSFIGTCFSWMTLQTNILVNDKDFREIDKMVTKHQKDNYERIVLPKIP